MKSVLAVTALASMLGSSMALQAAPISFADPSAIHTENFNIGTGTAYVLTTTVPGLSAYVSGGGTGNNGVADTSAPEYVDYANPQMLTYLRRNTAIGDAQAVTITSQRLAFYTANRNTGSGGYAAAGLSFVNDTGATINQFLLTYEAWHGTANQNSAPPDEVAFSYAIEAPDLADGSASWTYVAALSFVGSMDDSVTPPIQLISQTNPTAYVTGINWAPGEVLTLRWRDTNLASPAADRSLGVDNVVFSIPEPATLAVFGIAGTLLRRRRTA